MVPTPAMRAMRCRGAQNRAAPFFPPTALRRTVPPQQGGARVFLTTVLPYYWFACALRSGRRRVDSVGRDSERSLVMSPRIWRVLGVESVCELRAWSRDLEPRVQSEGSGPRSRRRAPQRPSTSATWAGRARASMDLKGNPKGGRAGARRRPLGMSSRLASDPEVSEGGRRVRKTAGASPSARNPTHS